MPEERIRMEVVRSGGFAGVKRTGRVDTADLDEERSAELRRLVAESTLTGQRRGPSAPRPGAADQFQYEITVVRGDDRRSSRLSEADLSEADRNLVRWVLREGRVTR
jgi:hypothetical protein